ncbi:MAG: hypothetical protein WCS72_19715, partial [Deltaproteobacteria bacterium]
MLEAALASERAALAAERAALAAERERVAELVQERDRLKASHERLRLELELLRRRIFVGTAERVDTTQLEMEFAATLAAAVAARFQLPFGPVRLLGALQQGIALEHGF